ncbi:MAG: ferredoxin family protein [Coriobacteriia bacterium]
MSVVRNDLSLCIGCGVCEMVCPMDVMYLDTEKKKSVIAYIQNCQTCGQCWLRCPTGSLGFQSEANTFAINACR